MLFLSEIEAINDNQNITNTTSKLQYVKTILQYHAKYLFLLRIKTGN